MHGKTDQIHHDGRTLYAGMPNPFTATRYHSLIIRNGTLPPEYEISAWTDARRDHGRAPQDLAAGRRAVSPGELPDRAGRKAAGEFPEEVTG